MKEERKEMRDRGREEKNEERKGTIFSLDVFDL